MSREPKRTGGKEDAQELVPILREAHARLRLWETCDKAGCRRCECCGGDVDRCGAGAAPEGWAWLRQVLNRMLAGASQDAKADGGEVGQESQRAASRNQSIEAVSPGLDDWWRPQTKYGLNNAESCSQCSR